MYIENVLTVTIFLGHKTKVLNLSLQYRQVSTWQVRTSTAFLSCHGNATVEVCRNNCIIPAAGSEAKPKSKSQSIAALCNTLSLQKTDRQLRPTLCVICTPTHFDLSFLSLCLLSLIYFLYFISCHELFLFIFSSFITSNRPSISFFSYTPTPFIHSFIHSCIHSSFYFFYSIIKTTIFILLIFSLSFSFCPDSNVP